MHRLIQVWFVLIVVTTIIFSCKRSTEEEQVICTMEFRTVSVKVNNGDLDEFYTLRVSNGDTIRYSISSLPFPNTYVILDDSYQQYFIDKTEGFRFQGFINDTMVVNELYTIKADQCHIDYVSGKQVIDL